MIKCSWLHDTEIKIVSFTFYSHEILIRLIFLQQFAITLLCFDYVGLTTAVTLGLSFSRNLVGQPAESLPLYVNTTISMVKTKK